MYTKTIIEANFFFYQALTIKKMTMTPDKYQGGNAVDYVVKKVMSPSFILIKILNSNLVIL